MNLGVHRASAPVTKDTHVNEKVIRMKLLLIGCGDGDHDGMSHDGGGCGDGDHDGGGYGDGSEGGDVGG